MVRVRRGAGRQPSGGARGPAVGSATAANVPAGPATGLACDPAVAASGAVATVGASALSGDCGAASPVTAFSAAATRASASWSRGAGTGAVVGPANHRP